ncbi:hypothetical protein E4U11_006989, partial [Claviceps purpurea]
LDIGTLVIVRVDTTIYYNSYRPQIIKVVITVKIVYPPEYITNDHYNDHRSKSSHKVKPL